MSGTYLLLMLSAFKPADSTKPVLLVSTNHSEGSEPVSEVKFVFSPSVEDALALLLDARSDATKASSEWIQIQRHRDTKVALEWGRHIAEVFQFVERVQQGEAVYQEIYERLCPDKFRVHGRKA